MENSIIRGVSDANSIILKKIIYFSLFQFSMILTKIGGCQTNYGIFHNFFLMKDST